MKLSAIPWIIMSIILNSVAQILLKIGADRIGGIIFNWTNLMPFLLQAMKDQFIWLSIFCYVLSLVTWIIVLTRVDVSIAYPLISLGYITNAFAAYFLFGESLTFFRIAGTFVILLGVFMIARS